MPSRIEWTDFSYAPWFGCTKVSPGCDACYAEHDMAHRFHLVEWGPHAPRRRKAASGRNKPLGWNRTAIRDGVRPRVFCSHYSDVFDNHPSIGAEWRADLWDLIRQTTSLDWLLLTKRPQNIRKMLPADWGDGWPNVWIGTTVENREEAARRIPYLRAVPARVRFLSCEPLLEAIEPDLSGIHWVIAGGETGAKDARVMRSEWAAALRDQCAAAGVAFFLKQMTRRAPIPADLFARQWPASPEERLH